MSLGEHLVEFRNRLFISAAAIIVAAIAGFFVSDFVLEALRNPVMTIAEGRQATLNYSTISGPFDVRVQIALCVGVIASSPIWLYQIFAFIVPGLTGREKRYTFGFFFSAVPLFATGCAVGWFIFPNIVRVLTGFANPDDASVIETKTYLDLVLRLVLAVGIGFVMPVFVVLLNFIGILSARAIFTSWRVAVLVILVFCGIATPPTDIVNMILLAIPMVILYFLAALIAWLNDRRRARRDKLLDDQLGELA